MAYIKFTDAFFADEFANDSFFPAVERNKVYRARKVKGREAKHANYDYIVHVKGDFLTQCVVGFVSWRDAVPARMNEIEIVKGERRK